MATDLVLGRQGRVATVTFNRPEKRNAFTVDMIRRWTGFMAEIESDPEIAALVVSANGPAFCAGADIGELKGRKEHVDELSFLHENIYPLFLAIHDSRLCTIAAVDGPAIAGGMDLALTCDLRIASRDALFCEHYVNLGLIPGDGGCWLLPRIVGKAKALELIWTGDTIDAEEALRIGLVNRLSEPGRRAADDAMALAERLSEGPTHARALAKRTLRAGLQTDFEANLDLTAGFATALRARRRDAESAAVSAAGGA